MRHKPNHIVVPANRCRKFIKRTNLTSSKLLQLTLYLRHNFNSERSKHNGRKRTTRTHKYSNDHKPIYAIDINNIEKR